MTRSQSAPNLQRQSVTQAVCEKNELYDYFLRKCVFKKPSDVKNKGDTDQSFHVVFDNALQGKNFESEIKAINLACTSITKSMQEFSPQIHRGQAKRKPSDAKAKRTGDSDDYTGRRRDPMLQDRLLRYRYVRHAVGELPPLVPSSQRVQPIGGEVEFVKKKRDTSIIERNRSLENLKEWYPERQSEIRRERSAELICRIRAARAKDLEQREEKVRRIEAKFEKWFGVKKPVVDEEALIRMFQCRWFTHLAASYFAIAVGAGLEAGRRQRTFITEEDEEDPDGAKERRRIAEEEVLEQARREAEEAEAKRRAEEQAIIDAERERINKLNWLKEVLLSKARIIRKRKSARLLFELLLGWQTNGRLVLNFKKFHFFVRRIQRSQRAFSKRMRAIREKYIVIWKRIERKMWAEEFIAKDNEEAKEGLLTEKIKLPLKERVEIAMMDDKVRSNFMAAEMRALRYAVVPKIRKWQTQMQSYWTEIGLWKEDRRACEALGFPFKGDAPVRPGCPSHLPTEKQIGQWFERARKNKNDVTKVEDRPPEEEEAPEEIEMNLDVILEQPLILEATPRMEGEESMI